MGVLADQRKPQYRQGQGGSWAVPRPAAGAVARSAMKNGRDPVGAAAVGVLLLGCAHGSSVERLVYELSPRVQSLCVTGSPPFLEQVRPSRRPPCTAGRRDVPPRAVTRGSSPGPGAVRPGRSSRLPPVPRR